MDYNNQNEYSWAEYSKPPKKPQKPEWRCPVSVVLVLLCIAVVATMMITFTLTASWVRAQDSVIIQEQQQAIKNLQETLADDDSFAKLEILATLLEQLSYYSDDFDKEEMLDAVMRAYIAATGDDYAAYYTDEEYAALSSDNAGAGVGIGVSVVQDTLTVAEKAFLTYQITAIFKGAPAQNSELRVGDHVYAVAVDGEFKTIEDLGGYTAMLNAIRGEVGTFVTLRAFRIDKDGNHSIIEVEIKRDNYTKESVSYRVSETDAKVGIVYISEFDLQAPVQFKEAVKDLQKQGVERFIFDVRNNPGGDLQSIRAVLSYLLHDGDLILTAIDNKGNYVSPVYAGAASYSGDYAPCSVLADEVGMFADLKMVVLCNGNTASAAEVFTASLRDHKNVTIVGETTFGKGIMQRYYSLYSLTAGAFDGYVKMTTHAYVTACGVPYHGIGITPTEGYAIELSEEALEYHFYLLPESVDNQLQKAIEAVQSK